MDVHMAKAFAEESADLPPDWVAELKQELENLVFDRRLGCYISKNHCPQQRPDEYAAAGTSEKQASVHLAYDHKTVCRR